MVGDMILLLDQQPCVYDFILKTAYMKSSIVEIDVMLVMVLLQQLVCHVGSLRRDLRHVEHRFLRRREMDLRGGSHCASRPW
jgi:hypothetical protein